MDESKKPNSSDLELDLTANIEVHLHNLSPADYKLQFMEDYNHCCLCGSELEFTHVAHFVHNQMSEEAFCPSCGIRTKKEIHGLQ